MFHSARFTTASPMVVAQVAWSALCILHQTSSDVLHLLKRYFADDYTDPIDTKAELTKDYVEKNSTLLAVPSMYEHGPLWKIQPGTKATPKLRENGTVDYPWHAWLASRFGEYKLPIVPPLKEGTQKFDLWLA